MKMAQQWEERPVKETRAFFNSWAPKNIFKIKEIMQLEKQKNRTKDSQI